MSDEIEIEEHDLLDDPTVRNIFPDIDRLKREILEYEYNEEHQEPTSTASNSQFDNFEVENDSNESVNKPETNLTPPDNLQDIFQNKKLNNGFIRGERGIEVQVHNNKIILGTKPAGAVETNSDHFENHVKPYCAVVVLEDFGIYLNNSSRYCNKCLIFFPTNSDYNIHKRKIHIESEKDFESVQEENTPKFHSQEIQKLKAVECKNQNIMVQKKPHKKLVRIERNNVNICFKCNKVFTRRDHLRSHLIRFHKISKEELSENLPDRRISVRNECFHCKKLFRTQNLLIEHIYSILQTPNNRSDKFANKMVIGNKTNKDFTPNNYKSGNEIKKLVEVSSIKKKMEYKNVLENKRNVANDARNLMKIYRCNFCFLNFKTLKYFIKHMSIKHKTVKNFQTAKIIFDPKCKHCPKKFDSVIKYNAHLYKCHRPKLIQAIKNSRKGLFNPIKSTSAVSKDFTQNYFRCKLCFVYFSNTANYYRHMTRIHKTSVPQSSNTNAKMVKFDPKCPYCPRMCNNLSSFNKHLYLNHPDKFNNVVEISGKASKTTSERGNNTVSDDVNLDTEYYTCNYCSLYFKTTKFFIRHMTIKHKLAKIPKAKKVKFNSKCKFCSKVCDTVKTYNSHIPSCHPQRANQVIKTKVDNANKAVSSNDIKNQKGLECYRCHFCPSYFMTIKYYVIHMKGRHKMTKMPKPKNAIFDSKCRYCPAILNEIKFYNKHLYNNHYAELNDVIEKAKKTYLVNTNNRNKIYADIKKVDSAKTFYRCGYCSYYLKSLKIYNRHVMNKHKVQNVHEVKKMVFDPKCKYCSSVASNYLNYNKHLGKYHSNRIHEVFKESSKSKTSPKICGLEKKDIATIKKTYEFKNLKVSQSGSMSLNTEKKISKTNMMVPISKSALFKCHKCDIHFLTIKSALDHSNHMEMLINWKCALCHRIFKDNDRWLHEKQHSFSNVFTVYDIDQSNISQILYKCSKCVMHFDESVVDSHHYECAKKVPQSYMCKICDILVDYKAQICHEYNHKHRHFTSNDFVIIETTAVCEETNKNKLNVKDKNNMKTYKTVDNISTKIANYQDKGESSHTYVLKKNLKRKMKNDENVEGMKSKKMKRYQNPNSSDIKLRSNNENINYSSEVSTNQQRHDKFALKLSFCNTCNSFVSLIGQKRKAHAQKRCAHMKSVVCKDCGLKLSTKTLSTHRQMHLRIKNLQLHHFKFYDIKTGKRVHPPMPEYETCGICDVNFISKGTLGSHVCSEMKYKVCDICKLKLFKPVFHLHMAFHKYRTDETGACASSDNTVVSNKTIEVSKNSKNILLLLYCCKVCYIFVDTYDRLIEHCQKHCLNNLSPHSEECKICNLPFEENCLVRHAKIHEIAGDYSFEKIFFDPFYFRFDHTVWLKHVFGSHSHLKKEDILLNSVYRHEHRFKMEIAQEGSPDLTLYKCVKCNCHVEADIIYQHVKNSCSDLRKYPCPICQLNFISSFSLQRHKTIHKDAKPRRYRIIQFNKQEDTELAKVIFGPPKLYVSYQCRHCNVVVGSTQRMSHKCHKISFTSCSDCGLLINEDIYELHTSMHKTLDSFISENIKVILFGQYQSHSEKYIAIESSFRGKIHDYSFYKCSKCNVCVKQKSLALNHTCCWKGQPRVACSICGLYFYADKLISHIKNHETDPDFALDNMIFIEFHPSLSKPDDDELQNKTIDKENSPKNIDLDSIDELKRVKETAVIMENPENAKDTTVGLESTKETEYPKDTAPTLENIKDTGLSQENMKDNATSLQNMNASAVGLESVTDTAVSLDNAKDTAVSIESERDTTVSEENANDTSVSLEKAHNAAETQEVAHDTALNTSQENNLPGKQGIGDSEKTADIYQCGCGLHFLDEISITEHFSQCGSKTKQAKQNCSKCGLLFTPNVLFKHLLTHHGDKNLQFKINIVEKSNKKIIYLQK